MESKKQRTDTQQALGVADARRHRKARQRGHTTGTGHTAYSARRGAEAQDATALHPGLSPPKRHFHGFQQPLALRVSQPGAMPLQVAPGGLLEEAQGWVHRLPGPPRRDACWTEQ